MYKAFYSYAMSISLRYAFNEDEAVQITNDSFIKVFKNIHTLEPSKSFKSWFRRILINTAIDSYRKNKKHVQKFNYEYSGPLPDNHEDIISTLTVQDITDMLNKLPDYHRLVFNLYEIEGFSHKEIATKLDISESTSRSYLTRAKKELRILFNKKFDTSYEQSV